MYKQSQVLPLKNIFSVNCEHEKCGGSAAACSFKYILGGLILLALFFQK